MLHKWLAIWHFCHSNGRAALPHADHAPQLWRVADCMYVL